MAGRGRGYNHASVVTLSPDQASQAIIASTTGSKGYVVTTAGTGSITMTRRYLPDWAIACTIVGVFFFLIGLLFLLCRQTETLTVTLAPDQRGTRIVVMGTGSRQMVNRLNDVLEQMPTLGSAGAAPQGATQMTSGETNSQVLSRWDQIEKFAQLRDSGVITDQEFEAEKTRLLNP